MTAPRPIDWGSTLFAALFAGCFFAALPAYFLHTVDGPARFDCRPGPWRCEVHRWVGYQQFHIEAPVDRLRVKTRTLRSRGRSSYEYQVVFEHDRNGVVPASGWVWSEPHEVVRRLEEARARNVSVTARLGSTFHTLMVGLTIFFFAVGAGIPLINDLGGRRAGPTPSPRGPRSRR